MFMYCVLVTMRLTICQVRVLFYHRSHISRNLDVMPCSNVVASMDPQLVMNGSSNLAILPRARFHTAKVATPTLAPK